MTTTTSTSTAVAVAEPVFSRPEQLALAGFLAGYTGLTRRPTLSTCGSTQAGADSVTSASSMPAVPTSSASPAIWKPGDGPGRRVSRRLCTVAGFYKYAVEEDLLHHSPAAHVRRPRLDYESHAIGLDRNELGALLVAAGLGTAAEHALISLLALNGLRVTEAVSADIQALGMERGHGTLTITRKGGKVVTIPLAPRTARAIDLAVGERCAGPIFLAPDGRGLDRHGAARIVRRAASRAGIIKPVGPHTLRHAFITAALDAGVPLRDVQEAASHADPRTTIRHYGPAPHWTGTPPISSRRSSPGPPGS